jgi:hypothetical protein
MVVQYRRQLDCVHHQGPGFSRNRFSGITTKLTEPTSQRELPLVSRTRRICFGGFGPTNWYARHAINLWGEASLEASPLCDFESLKEGSIPTVTPMDKILDEGNCVRVSNRGEEACECAGKLTRNRRQPHSRQSCEATNRNPIQGRFGEVSEPTITIPFSNFGLVNWEPVQRKLITLSWEDWTPTTMT